VPHPLDPPDPPDSPRTVDSVMWFVRKTYTTDAVRARGVREVEQDTDCDYGKGEQLMSIDDSVRLLNGARKNDILAEEERTTGRNDPNVYMAAFRYALANPKATAAECVAAALRPINLDAGTF
jgi:hypothetical protein